MVRVVDLEKGSGSDGSLMVREVDLEKGSGGDGSLMVWMMERKRPSPMAFSQLTEQACRKQRKIKASGLSDV